MAWRARQQALISASLAMQAGSSLENSENMDDASSPDETPPGEDTALVSDSEDEGSEYEPEVNAAPVKSKGKNAKKKRSGAPRSKQARRDASIVAERRRYAPKSGTLLVTENAASDEADASDQSSLTDLDELEGAAASSVWKVKHLETWKSIHMAGSVVRNVHSLSLSKSKQSFKVLYGQPLTLGASPVLRISDFFADKTCSTGRIHEKLMKAGLFLTENSKSEVGSRKYAGKWFSIDHVQEMILLLQGVKSQYAAEFQDFAAVQAVIEYAEQLEHEQQEEVPDFSWHIVDMTRRAVRHNDKQRELYKFRIELDGVVQDVSMLVPMRDSPTAIRLVDCMSMRELSKHRNSDKAMPGPKSQYNLRLLLLRQWPKFDECSLGIFQRGTEMDISGNWYDMKALLDIVSTLPQNSAARFYLLPEACLREMYDTPTSQTGQLVPIEASRGLDIDPTSIYTVTGPTIQSGSEGGVSQDLHRYELLKNGEHFRTISRIPPSGVKPGRTLLVDLCVFRAGGVAQDHSTTKFQRDYPAIANMLSKNEGPGTSMNLTGNWITDHDFDTSRGLLGADKAQAIFIPLTALEALRQQWTAVEGLEDKPFLTGDDFSSCLIGAQLSGLLKRVEDSAHRWDSFQTILLSHIRGSMVASIAMFVPEELSHLSAQFVQDGQSDELLFQKIQKQIPTCFVSADFAPLPDRLHAPVTPEGSLYFGTSAQLPYVVCPGCDQGSCSFKDWLAAHPDVSCNGVKVEDTALTLSSLNPIFIYVGSDGGISTYSSAFGLLKSHYDASGNKTLSFFWALQRTGTIEGQLFQALGDALALYKSKPDLPGIAQTLLYLTARVVSSSIYVEQAEARLSLVNATQHLVLGDLLDPTCLDRLAAPYQDQDQDCTLICDIICKALIDTFPSAYLTNVDRSRNIRRQSIEGSRDETLFKLACKARIGFGVPYFWPPGIIEDAGAIFGVSRYSREICDVDPAGKILSFKDGSMIWRDELAHFQRIRMVARTLGSAYPGDQAINLCLVEVSLASWPQADYRARQTPQARQLACLLPNGVFSRTFGQRGGAPIVFVVAKVATFLCVEEHWTTLLGHWIDGWVIYVIEDLEVDGTPVSDWEWQGIGQRVWKTIPIYIPRFCLWLRDQALARQEQQLLRLARARRNLFDRRLLLAVQTERRQMLQQNWPGPTERAIFQWLAAAMKASREGRADMHRNRL